VKSVQPWSEERIAAERQRMTDKPNRLDRVKAFRLFVATNTAPIQTYSTHEGFLANLARNDAPAGPVHEAGELGLKTYEGIKLIKRFGTQEIYNPLPSRIAVLDGHHREVISVAINVDGTKVISGGYDYSGRYDISWGHCESWDCEMTVRLWDVRTGECLKVLKGHDISVDCIALSADGRFAVSGGSSAKTVCIWNLDSGQCLKVLHGHDSDVCYVALTADGNKIFSWDSGETVRVWDADSGKCIKTFFGMGAKGIVSADGKKIVSRNNDKTVRIWDGESGECLNVLYGHEADVNCVALSFGGNKIFSWDSEETVRVWDIDSGNCTKVFRGIGVEGIVSADETKIISNDRDNLTRIWDAETGELIKDFIGPEVGITSMTWSGDGRIFATVFDGYIYDILDGTVAIWDVEKGGFNSLETYYGGPNFENGWLPKGHGPPPLAISADGKRAVSGGLVGRIWDVKRGECLRVLKGGEIGFDSLAISSDGSRIISSSQDNAVRIWNGETGNCLKVLEHDWVGSVALSPDGRHIVYGSETTLRIYDSESGECLKVLEADDFCVSAIAVSGDGEKIVSGGLSKDIKIWDLKSGKCLKKFDLLADRLSSFAVDHYGKTIVSVSDEDIVEVWDEKSVRVGFGKSLHGHSMTVNSAAVNSEGSRVITASSDHTIRVWDAEKCRCLAVFFRPGMFYLSAAHDLKSVIIGFIDGRKEFHEITNLK
jgi:WD40 repeat protein